MAGELVSVDANVLVHALNRRAPEHERARRFLEELGARDDVVLAEQTLVEVYLLVRNPAIFPRPMSASAAAQVCAGYRAHPRWRLVECEPVMADVWHRAGASGFARRRIIDVRLALTLVRAGVAQFATGNVKDFKGLGFERVWDPLEV